MAAALRLCYYQAMNNDNIRDIAQAILKVLKPATDQANGKMVTVHFQPTDQYADCYVRSFRKGGGFLGLGAPAAGSPIVSLDIAITLKPGVMTDKWVGYTIDIKNPETNPEMTLSGEWPEAGGMVPNIGPEKLQQLTPHVIALMSVPTTPDGKAAPRQAPDSMF